MRIRFNEEGRKALVPESEVVFPLDYCLTCIAESAIKNTGFPQIADGETIEATAWINDQKYEINKTLKELTIEGNALAS